MDQAEAEGRVFTANRYLAEAEESLDVDVVTPDVLIMTAFVLGRAMDQIDGLPSAHMRQIAFKWNEVVYAFNIAAKAAGLRTSLRRV